MSEEKKPGSRIDLYFAPLLLVVVALIQMGRVYTVHQTPWKGGGFGMFSTQDSTSARIVRSFLVTDKGDFQVSVPTALDRDETILRAVPIEKNLIKLANGLSKLTWVPEGYYERRFQKVKDEKDDSDEEVTYLAINRADRVFNPEEVAKVDAVRIEVWREYFDSETNTFELRKWLEKSVGVSPDK